jgi:hypothetical protein
MRRTRSSQRHSVKPQKLGIAGKIESLIFDYQLYLNRDFVGSVDIMTLVISCHRFFRQLYLSTAILGTDTLQVYSLCTGAEYLRGKLAC